MHQIESVPLKWPRKLPLLDHAGERLAWIDGGRAALLWRQDKVRLHVRARKVRAVQVQPATADRTEYVDSRFRRTRYSHNHETDDNPEGVWTLIRLPKHTRAVFLDVLRSCVVKEETEQDSLAA